MNVVFKSAREIVISLKVVIGVFLLMMNPLIASADIAADAYCQLSIECMQQEVKNFQVLITLVNQYQDDRETLNQQEEIKKAEFSQARDAIFLSFGITDTEYGAYMGSNSQAVKKYLEDNPSIKQQIDDLSDQANSLMEQYEALKGEEEQVPAEPPVQ